MAHGPTWYVVGDRIPLLGGRGLLPGQMVREVTLEVDLDEATAPSPLAVDQTEDVVVASGQHNLERELLGLLAHGVARVTDGLAVLEVHVDDPIGGRVVRPGSSDVIDPGSAAVLLCRLLRPGAHDVSHALDSDLSIPDELAYLVALRGVLVLMAQVHQPRNGRPGFLACRQRLPWIRRVPVPRVAGRLSHFNGRRPVNRQEASRHCRPPEAATAKRSEPCETG